VVRAVAAAVASGAATLALELPSLPSAVLGLVIYVAALLALGIVPAEIREAVLRRGRHA
jgi:Na+/citrate or Na+/malate symporter